MSLTVTADGGRRTGDELVMPSWPVALLLLAGTALAVILLAVLAAAFPQPGSPWPLLLSLVPACLFLTAAAVATVPVTTRPVDRAEKVLRGLVAAAVPVVASLLLARVSTVSAFALAILPALIVAGGVVAARRTGGQQAALSETGGATKFAGRGLPAQPLPLLCRWLKRSVDVVVAGTVLVLGLPVLAFAAVAIAVEGRGGVLFSQT
ncbi:MAG TPA: hypothetical protein VGR26_12950, partial [Acidimicrobiales bacterium]|nr:hypothetical protein [Acidimicrobiales bacterium]